MGSVTRFKGSKKINGIFGVLSGTKFTQNENLNHSKPRGSLAKSLGVYCTNFLDIVLYGRRRDFFNILTNTRFSQELLFLLLLATQRYILGNKLCSSVA